MSMEDSIIYDLDHIPLDRDFGDEIETKFLGVLRRMNVPYESYLGTKEDTDWGTDFKFGVNGSMVRLDVTAEFFVKDNMVELPIEPLEIWGSDGGVHVDETEYYASEIVPYATLHFGVRRGNKRHKFNEKVLVLGIETGRNRIYYKNQLRKLFVAMHEAIPMLSRCLTQAQALALGM